MDGEKSIAMVVRELDNRANSKISTAIVARLVDSLEKNPRVGLACKRAKISTGTFYNWYRRWPEFARLMDEAQASGITLVEDRLFENAMSGDTTAQIFLMKKHKPERYEDARPPEPAPPPTELFDISGFDDQDNADLARLIAKAQRIKMLSQGGE